jgi:hypothetical protein
MMTNKMWWLQYYWSMVLPKVSLIPLHLDVDMEIIVFKHVSGLLQTQLLCWGS